MNQELVQAQSPCHDALGSATFRFSQGAPKRLSRFVQIISSLLVVGIPCVGLLRNGLTQDLGFIFQTHWATFLNQEKLCKDPRYPQVFNHKCLIGALSSD